MQWRNIEQKNPKPGQNSEYINRLSVDVFGDHMLAMKNEEDGGFDQLYCCNRRKRFCFILTRFSLDNLDSWSTIDVKGLGGIRMVGNSAIYKNCFYACVTIGSERKKLLLVALDLESKTSEILLSLFNN